MICPYCGASIRDFVPVCQMCGNEIDKDKLFRTYYDKAEANFASGVIDAAIVNYKKALEFRPDAATHIKLGLCYQKKNMKTQAASEYVKALACDFSNEAAHNMLVNVYVSQGRHSEIRAWYEKNATQGDATQGREELSARMIKIIDTSKQFLENAPEVQPEIKPDPIPGKLGKKIITYIKSYALINAVLAVGVILVAAAFVLSSFFKIDPVIMLSATAFFFLAAAIMFFVMRARKKNEKAKGTETELLSELKAMAEGKSSADK